jgi:hypothetical protein
MNCAVMILVTRETSGDLGRPLGIFVLNAPGICEKGLPSRSSVVHFAHVSAVVSAGQKRP